MCELDGGSKLDSALSIRNHLLDLNSHCQHSTRSRLAMEFLNDVGTDPSRPSLFELVAQEQLRDLLQPAMKYILSVRAFLADLLARKKVTCLGLRTKISTLSTAYREQA